MRNQTMDEKFEKSKLYHGNFLGIMDVNSFIV